VSSISSVLDSKSAKRKIGTLKTSTTKKEESRGRGRPPKYNPNSLRSQTDGIVSQSFLSHGEGDNKESQESCHENLTDGNDQVNDHDHTENEVDDFDKVLKKPANEHRRSRTKNRDPNKRVQCRLCKSKFPFSWMAELHILKVVNPN